MIGLNSFSKKFCDASPLKNVEEPAKPKISDAERTGISDKEHHAISSNTDAHSVMIVVDKEGNRVEPKKKDAAPKMSPVNADISGDITKPTYTGGYRGGGDIKGGYYVSTSKMNEKIGDSLEKIGKSIGGAIDGGGSVGEGVGGDVAGEIVKNENNEDGEKSSLCELNPGSSFC